MFRRLHGLLEISGGVRKTRSCRHVPLKEMHVWEATRPAIDQWWSEKDAELQTCATEGDACSGGYTACYRSVVE